MIDALFYTDGSCSVNPGTGSWGFILVKEDTVIIKSSLVKDTTNNRMELMAILEVLRYSSKQEFKEIKIVSDSMYCINCFNNWCKIWWRDVARREEAKNADLWNEVFTITRDNPLMKVKFEWVKGHNNDKYNTMIDKVVQIMSGVIKPKG